MTGPEPDLAAIAARLGRPLRVLHIGNIANNAYNNARIQRHYGIEADVLCYGDYYIMSSPEWESGGFSGALDPVLPDWFATSMGGWRRPDWFAQGPSEACCRYLMARRIGLTALAELLWRDLQARYWLLLDAAKPGRPPMPEALARAHEFVRFHGLDQPGIRLAYGTMLLDAARRAVRGAYQAVLDNAIMPKLARGERKSVSVRLWLLFRRLRGLREPEVSAAPAVPDRGAWRRTWTAIRRAAGDAAASFWRPLVLGLEHSSAILRLRRLVRVEARRAARPAWQERFAARRDAILARARAISPEVEHQTRDYIAKHAVLFTGVLSGYDIVQGYSIDGFIPWINGFARFVSYEHGTIRELPWEPSLVGVVCRQVYEESPQVFITNTDVLPSAARLGLDRSRTVYLPHAFSPEKLWAWRDKHPDLKPPPGEVRFFSPTRHHWRDRSRSWSKGNDVFLRAAARLAREGRRFQILLVEWGKEVAESRALIEALGLADRVTWVAPMHKETLWETYLTHHAVVDQFVLPAMGGVSMEALALGRRLIAALDLPCCEEFFGAAPPCLAAMTEDACVAAMTAVLDDPGDQAGIGAAAAEWIRQYHSAERIAGLQVATYRQMLEEPAERI